MGVLDDAIREHLELKKQRGATDEEIARQEAEALTPARRGPAAETPQADPPPVDEPPVEDPPVEPPPVEEEPPVDPAPEPVHDIDEDPLEPPPPMRGETVEIPAAELPDAPPLADSPGAGEGDDDVLEETPEFLRETPEHDRLWFEQKPPRDFDLED
jgi:hypothetical protein